MNAKSNPLGPGTANVAANVPKELAEKIEKLAEKSGLSKSAYIAAALEEVAQKSPLFERVVRRRGK